jgi:hypothetical protein
MLLIPRRPPRPSYLVYYVAARDLIEYVSYDASLASRPALTTLLVGHATTIAVAPCYLAYLIVSRLGVVEVLR